MQEVQKERKMSYSMSMNAFHCIQLEVSFVNDHQETLDDVQLEIQRDFDTEQQNDL